MTTDKERIAELTAKLDTAIEALAERDDKEARFERKLAERQARKFKRLNDGQWVNIVNHPDVLKRDNYDAEDAVAAAFKLIEKKLEEINSSDDNEELNNLLAKAKEEGRKEAVQWQSIETAPKDEKASFLVLTGGNSMADSLVLQVSMFQGDMYPDYLDTNVDWEDRIENATHWMPPLAAPKPQGETK